MRKAVEGASVYSKEAEVEVNVPAANRIRQLIFPDPASAALDPDGIARMQGLLGSGGRGT